MEVTEVNELQEIRKPTQKAALALAAAGLFMFAATAGGDDDSECAVKAKDLVHCYGVNICKGHNDCKAADNACAGQGSCKGTGFVAVTAKTCADIGGEVGP